MALESKLLKINNWNFQDLKLKIGSSKWDISRLGGVKFIMQNFSTKNSHFFLLAPYIHFSLLLFFSPIFILSPILLRRVLNKSRQINLLPRSRNANPCKNVQHWHWGFCCPWRHGKNYCIDIGRVISGQPNKKGEPNVSLNVKFLQVPLTFATLKIKSQIPNVVAAFFKKKFASQPSFLFL